MLLSTSSTWALRSQSQGWPATSAEVTKFNWQLLLALKDSSLNKFLHAIKSNNSKNIEKLFDAICPPKSCAELNQGSQMWFFCQLAKQLKL